MPSFILDYDSLESIAGYSSSLGKRAEEYGEELENQVIHAIGAVTGPSSGCLQNASDSVKDKVMVLKQKSADFYNFADQVTKLLETAQQTDQEVADAIAAKRDYFLEHYESLRLDDRKMKLLDLLVDIKNSNPILAEIADLLGTLSVNVESLNDSLKHWYRCNGKKPAKIPDKEESSDGSIELELKGQLLNDFLSDPLLLLLLSGTLEIPGLNLHVRNGKVYLKIETAEKYKNTVWSATGEFISGVGDTAVNTVTDLKDLVLHPIKTGRGLVYLANLSNKEKLALGAKIGTEIRNSFNANVIHGTPDTRAHFTGRALGEVALALIGTKGVDKAAKALKAGKAAKAAQILDNLEEGASDLSKTNKTIAKVEDSLDSVIKETYKPPKVNKEIKAPEDLTRGPGAISKEIIENGKKITQFDTPADPIRDILGAGSKSNPEEWNKIIKELEDSGVEIVYRKGTMGYGPLKKGEPGQLIIDPDASLCALQHEKSHFLEAQSKGFPSAAEAYQDWEGRIADEFKAYTIEIEEAKKLGLDNVAEQLQKNFEVEKQYIIDRYGPID